MRDSSGSRTAPTKSDPRAVLTAAFYLRPTRIVAKDLLGRVLCRRLEDGQVLRARIVETEAYEGLSDRACHTSKGKKTERTRPMWGPGGRAYVYLIYGMYDCLNAVTGEAGVPEAVLIRAAEPIEGNELLKEKLPHLKEKDWLKGPGRLTRALAIDRSFSGVSLQSEDLWLEAGQPLSRSKIGTSTRINVDYAGTCAAKPLRFFEKGSPFISGKKSLNEGSRSPLKALPLVIERLKGAIPARKPRRNP